MQRGVYRFEPTEVDNGSRLDQFLPGVLADLSRTKIRKLIDFGAVHVNGKRTRTCSHPIRTGDKIELFCDGLPLEEFCLTDETILYRDKHLLVLDKPAGIDCQPTPSRFKGTVYSALWSLLANPKQPRQRPSIGMVQRLDRDTSGVMVFSVHPRAHQSLTRQFSDRTVKKTYLAMVSGRLPEGEGEFHSLLAKNRKTNLMKSVEKGGQEAITRFRTLQVADDASLVEVTLLTGRSHQIRVHFSEAGHPLVGDTRYGGPSLWRGNVVSRQMLHAWHLGLFHPISAEDLQFEAPLPVDMSFLLTILKQEPS